MFKVVLHSQTWKVIAVIFVALTLVNTAVFFSGPFWDDYEFVFSNVAIIEQNDPFVFWKEGSGYERVWALGYTQFWFLVRAFEHNFWAYKFVSIFFHSLNTFLIYRLAKVIRLKHAYFVAPIFMFHPFHVETLSWIFQLNTILGLFWSLVSTHLLIEAFNLKNLMSPTKRVLTLIGFSVCYFLSLKTKPIALLIPFCTIFLADLTVLKKHRSSIIVISLFLIAFGVYISLVTNNAITNSAYENSIRKTYFFDELFGRVAFGPSVTTIDGGVAYHTAAGKFLLKLHLISRNFLFYISSFFIPMNFMFIYPKWELNSTVGALAVSVFILTIIAIMYALIKVKDKRSLLPISIVFAGFLPVSGLIYIPYMKYSYVADHWAYVLCAGWALFAVQIIGVVEDHLKFKSLKGLMILFVLLLGIQQARYGRIFNSTREMLEYNIGKNPNSVFLYQYLARLFIDDALKGEALRVIEAGLRVAPSDDQLMRLKSEI